LLKPAVQPDVRRAGDLALDLPYRQATVAGQPVRLTRTEFRLLAALAAEPGRVFSRSDLRRALGLGERCSERTIDSHVKNLRSKIERDPRRPAYLQTIYGVGYCLASSGGPVASPSTGGS
jgi:DNA-binding response OmpR family regulator